MQIKKKTFRIENIIKKITDKNCLWQLLNIQNNECKRLLSYYLLSPIV